MGGSDVGWGVRVSQHLAALEHSFPVERLVDLPDHARLHSESHAGRHEGSASHENTAPGTHTWAESHAVLNDGIVLYDDRRVHDDVIADDCLGIDDGHC